MLQATIPFNAIPSDFNIPLGMVELAQNHVCSKIVMHENLIINSPLEDPNNDHLRVSLGYYYKIKHDIIYLKSFTTGRIYIDDEECLLVSKAVDLKKYRVAQQVLLFFNEGLICYPEGEY